MTVLAPPYVIAPGGVSAGSTWIPIPVLDPAHPAVVLAPQIDATTGERTSLFVGVDPTYAAILTQFRTVFASGVAVPDDGQRFADIRKNGDDAPARIGFEVERIFKPFVDAGLVRVDSVDTTAGPSSGWAAGLVVRFTLLETGRPVSIP